MADAKKKYRFPTVAGREEVFELSRINEAMDTFFENGQSEANARYALLHTYEWPATEAVSYAALAVFLIESRIDPNRPGELEGIAEPVTEA